MSAPVEVRTAVLQFFGEKVYDARSQYRAYVEKGIAIGRREDLIGGGLIRSHGGWANVKAMRRAKIIEKADERILGDGDFVQNVLAAAGENMKRCYAFQANGVNLESLAERVAEIFDIASSDSGLDSVGTKQAGNGQKSGSGLIISTS